MELGTMCATSFIGQEGDYNGSQLGCLRSLSSCLLSAGFLSFLPLGITGEACTEKGRCTRKCLGAASLPSPSTFASRQPRYQRRVWVVRSLAALLSYSQPLTQLFPLKFVMYFHIKLKKKTWGGEGMGQVERGRRELRMIARWNKCATWGNYKCLKTGVCNESALRSRTRRPLFQCRNTVKRPLKPEELDLIRWVVYEINAGWLLKIFFIEDLQLCHQIAEQSPGVIRPIWET